MELRRTCVYPKDVQRMTGKSERAARRLLEKIRKRFDKQAHQFVTIDEFASFTGISPDLIRNYIDD